MTKKSHEKSSGVKSIFF